MGLELATTRQSRVRLRTVTLRVVGGLAVGAALTLAFLRLVHISAVYQRLAHLELGFAALCGVVFLGAFVLRGLRWRCLLRPSQVSVLHAVAIYQIATFLNWLLPVRGGEVAKCLLLRHTDQVPVSRSLATVSMDKTLDLVPAAALLAALPLAGFTLSGPLWLLLSAALAAVACAIGLVLLAAWRRDRAIAIVTRPLVAVLPERTTRSVQAGVVTFVDTLLALVRQPRLMLVALGYTAAAVCCDALFCWLAFRAVDAAVSVPVAAYGYTFFNLSFVLPTPPGQVGSNELIGLAIFSGMFGIGRSAVGAMFLFSHPWTAVLMTCSGLACLSALGLTLPGTFKLARSHAERSER